MRISFLYVLLFVSAQVYAQHGFYLKPLVESTVVTNQGKPYNFSTQQGYTLHIRPLNCYYLDGWYDIGLHIGYRTKKMFTEIGISSSGSNSGFVATGMSYLPNGNGYIYQFGNNGGVTYTKYPIRLGWRIFGKDSLKHENKNRWECFLFGGIDFLKNPGEGDPVLVVTGTNYQVNTNQDTLTFLSKTKVGVTKSYLATIGIMLKGYNKRNRNIFNIGIHYSQGHDVMSSLIMECINYDGTVYWGTPMRSKGSGIFIDISKDIYPSNIFRKREKKPITISNRISTEPSYYIGIEASKTNNRFTVNDSGLYCRKPFATFQIGLNFRKDINKHFSYEAALIKHRYSGGINFKQMNDVDCDHLIIKSYLVPLRLIFRQKVINDKIFLSATTGYTLGFSHSTQLNYASIIYPYPGGDTLNIKPDHAPKTLKYFSLLQGGGGIEFKLANQGILSFNANYYWGIGTLINMPVTTSINSTYIHHAVWKSRGSFWDFGISYKHPIRF